MIKKLFILIYFFYFFTSNNLFSQSIIFEDIERLTSEDLNAITSINLKQETFSENEINIIIKDFIKSNLINDVKLINNADNYILKISETPLINNIYINGNIYVKDSDIMPMLKSKNKEYLDLDFIKDDSKLIIDIYNFKGFINPIVDTSIEYLDGNTVNLIFEITEDKKKLISNIYFKGNDFISSSKLRSIIKSKQKQIFSFFSSSDYLDESLIINDLQLIKNIYKDNGFIDVVVEFKIIAVNNKLQLSFYISEFNRYSISNIEYNFDTLNNSSLFDDLITDFSSTNTDAFFSLLNIEKHIEKMNKVLSNNNLSNFYLDYNFTKENNKINLSFNTLENPIQYISKINITGNAITKDTTIRDIIYFQPGDLINSYLIDKSKKSILKKDYVENVVISSVPETSNSSNIEINIKEKNKTGNFFVGGNFSSSLGASASVGISDDNIFGTGNKLDSKFTVGSKAFLFDLDYTKFKIFNLNVENNYTFYNKDDDFKSTLGYKSSSKGIGFSAKLPYKFDNNIDQYFRIGLSFDNTNITDISTTASSAVSQNKGLSNNFSIKSLFVYDSRDDSFNPGSGLYSLNSMQISPPSVSDDNFIKLVTNNNFYYSFPRSEKGLFVLTKLGFVQGFDDKVKSKNAFSLGGGDFRGFSYSGIGPRDNNNKFLGGTKLYKATFGYSSPVLFDDTDLLMFKIFTNVGSLHDSDFVATYDSSKLRSSVGASLDYLTPIGPLSLSYTKSITQESWDKDEDFDFSIGTTF